MAALPFAAGAARSRSGCDPSGKRPRLARDAKWGRRRRGQSGGPIAAVGEIRGADTPGFKPGAIERTKAARLDLTQYGTRRSALFMFSSLPNCPQGSCDVDIEPLDSRIWRLFRAASSFRGCHAGQINALSRVPSLNPANRMLSVERVKTPEMDAMIFVDDRAERCGLRVEA